MNFKKLSKHGSMNRHKKKRINIKKERVILSDVLPYEIPVSFSNRKLRHFLTTNGVRFSNNTICWDRNYPDFELIIKLLFGIDKNKTVRRRQIKLNAKELRTIPFRFKISHKDRDFRELVVIHPQNQLRLIEFYEKNKETILYYCSISPFSIRKPYKIAKIRYHKDRLHLEKLAYEHEHKLIEEFDKEYEHLRAFFTYKKYNNIYKFYESYEYHRCEKKYNKLFIFDISKCFDSIYTHSLTWALLNKEIVKDDLGKIKGTFGDEFDKLMQNLNYGETNGIIIGPEFSRIFAELILQRIDCDVINTLQKNRNSNNSLNFKIDYEIFRYVDDIFVFYDNDETRDRVLDAYRYHLMKYKLYVNDSKTSSYEKPIITGITIAKQKISDLLNKNLVFKISEEDRNKNEVNEEEEKEKRYSFYVSSNKLITRFKTIITESGIKYKDVLNYTFVCLDRKVLRLIKTHKSIEDKRKNEQETVKWILELLDFTFFLYCASPRVNTTVKLCMILSKIIRFVKVGNDFDYDKRHLVFKKIYDEIYSVLRKNRNSEYTQVETLYLLISLQELGREYRLDENFLSDCFGITLNNGKDKYRYDLNYFSITVLLFYIKDIRRYNTLKGALEEIIMDKFKKKNKLKMAELTLLLFDILACPYIDNGFKCDLLQCYKITNVADQNKIIKRKECWFTKWTDFDLSCELEAKKSQEVY